MGFGYLFLIPKERGVGVSIIITIANHKGGVGKTSNAVNTAIYLSKYYRKGLLLDFDPQADASRMFYDESDRIRVKIHDLFSYAVANELDFNVHSEALKQFNKMLQEATVTTLFPDKGIVTLVPSSLDLTKTKIAISSVERLTNFIIPSMVNYIAQGYDYVIIDTPPSIELLTFTAVLASDYLIIPIELEATSLKGARDIIHHILEVANRYYNSKVELLGVIINKYNQRTNLSRELEPVIKREFGELLFTTKISASVRIQELSVMRKTLSAVAKGTRSDREYEKLAQEIYERINSKGAEK